MPDTPWYAEFFGEDYLRVYRPYLTPERTEAEVVAIVRLLGLPAGGAILDLACGQGRLTVPLAALGYQMTGLDLSPALLRRARAAARAAGVRVRWLRADMRAIPAQAEFAAVINIFTAFGYLESDEEDLQVLRQVHRALAPGGLFLLETAHRDGLAAHFVPADVQRHDDGLLVVHEQQFDLRSGRLQAQVTLFEPDGAPHAYRQDMRIYTLTELEALLHAAGLQLIGYFGGLDGSPLTLTSPRLALLARKR